MFDNQEPTSWVLPDATSHVLGQHPVVVTTASPDNANQFALDFAQAFLHSNSPMSHDEMIKWVTKAAALIEEQARRIETLEEKKEMLIIDIRNVGTEVRDAMKKVMDKSFRLSNSDEVYRASDTEDSVPERILDWVRDIEADIESAVERMTDDIQEAIEESNQDY